jgi:hypothetical protein
MKNIDLQEAMLQQKDDMIKAHVSEQLKHLRHHQGLAFEALKLHDAKYNTVDPAEYANMSQQMGE